MQGKLVFDFVLLGNEALCKSIANVLASKGYPIVMIIPPGKIDIAHMANVIYGIQTVDKGIVVLGKEGIPMDPVITNAMQKAKNAGKPNILFPNASEVTPERVVDEILKIVD